MRVILPLLAAISLQANELTVNVIDGTNGGPGTADMVQLMHHEGGMVVLQRQDNVQGSVTLTWDKQVDRGLLLQAKKGPVTFSQEITDVSQPASIRVFESSDQVNVTTFLGTLAFFAEGDRMEVNYFYNVDNNEKRVLIKDGTIFEFPVPNDYDQLEVSTMYQNGMPLRHQANVNGGRGGLHYPIKPGRTQVVVSTAHPYNQQGSSYVLPVPDNQNTFTFMAMPAALTLTAEGLIPGRPDTERDIRLYQWTRPIGATELSVAVSGTAVVEEPQTQQAHADSSSIERVGIEIDRYRWSIVAAVLALMSFAAFWGYRH